MQNNVHLIALFNVAFATSLKILVTDWRKGNIKSVNIEWKETNKEFANKEKSSSKYTMQKVRRISIKHLIKYSILLYKTQN